MARGFRFIRPRFSEGWLQIGLLRNAPVRLHWSAPLGCLFFGGFAFVPGFWLGFLLVILIHELGHAFVVRRARQTVLSVDVHGLGGVCQWVGNASPIERACIAWGGVWGQMALLVVALPVWLLVPTYSVYQEQFLQALVRGNLFLAALNLLPIPPLDGAEAWKLPKLLWNRRKRKAQLATQAPQKGKLGSARSYLRVVPNEVDDDEPMNENARKAVERAKEIASKKYLN
jgi:stage IV sporulation protein FB